jgi:hypothetical protein
MSRTPHELHGDLHFASSSDQPNQHLPHLFNQNHNHGHDQNHNAQHEHYTKPLIPFQPRLRKRTSILSWCMAAICTIFWVAVILLGLAVLIVYLLYRPKSPQFDIVAGTLNAGYIDTGNLLNADITLLANVINPNTKVNIYFSYLQLDMYYQV